MPLVPRHSFSLWNRYDVTERVGLGLGVIARSKSYRDDQQCGEAARLCPRRCARSSTSCRGGIEAQVNVENILGADYFPTANSDNNIAPGAPRTIKATARAIGF